MECAGRKDLGNLPAPLTVTSIALMKGAVEGWTMRFRLWRLKKSDQVVHNQPANSGTEASRLEQILSQAISLGHELSGVHEIRLVRQAFLDG
jgi:hypothetical protein